MKTFSSSRVRLSKFLLVTFAGLACSGCFTGHLVESGRRHESLLRYDRVTAIGNELVIEYTATRSSEPPVLEATTEPNSAPLNARPRAVAIPIDALASAPPIAVEDFPLRRLRLRRNGAERSTGRDVPLHRGSQSPTPQSSQWRDFIEVDVKGNREQGLRVCDHKHDACGQRFNSETLYQSSLAWWVYPLVPLTVAIDVAVMPIHVITLPILVTTGD